MFYKMLICTLLIILLIGLGPAGAQEPDAPYAPEAAKVYATPDETTDPIATLPANAALRIEGRTSSGAWVLAHTQDEYVRGWVPTRRLTWSSSHRLASWPVISEPPDLGTPRDAVTLSLYNTPTAAGRQVAVLPRDVRVAVVGRNFAGSWLQVQTEDMQQAGTSAWVEARYLSLDPTVPLMALPVVSVTPPPTASADITLYAGPGTQYDVKASIAQATPLTIEGRDAAGRWLLVHAQNPEGESTEAIGPRGWASARYVALSAGDLGALPTLSTLSDAKPADGTADTVLYAGPEGDSLVEAIIPAGTRLIVEGRTKASDWFLAYTPDRVVRGWVSASDFTLDPNADLDHIALIDPDANIIVSSQAGLGTSPTDGITLPIYSLDPNINLHSSYAPSVPRHPNLSYSTDLTYILYTIPELIPWDVWLPWASFTPWYAQSRANWYAEYFQLTSPADPTDPSTWGAPAFARIEPEINYNWGTGGPDMMLTDGWGARWTTRMFFDSGEWFFGVQADDGVRLLLDDRILIDTLQGQAIQNYHWHTWVQIGYHKVTLEYFDMAGSAVTKLLWWKVNEPHQPPAEFNVQGATEPTVLFHANRYTIYEGECVTVTWDATPVRLKQVYLDERPVHRKGSSEICPRHSSPVSLRITYDDDFGNEPDEFLEFDEFYRLWIDVIPQANPYPVTFTVSSNDVLLGENVTISWHAPHAREVYLNGMEVEHTGSRIMAQTARLTPYILYVINNDWSVQVWDEYVEGHLP